MPAAVNICGVDEAGRGPLAGPVMVAAVVLDPRRPIAGINDSKQLSATQRETLDREIREHALAWHIISIGVAGIAPVILFVADIDRKNILQATLLGMRRALAALSPTPALALIDGNRVPTRLPCQARAIVEGDALEPCIGAASILAKVARDRYMVELDARFPGYGFAAHKGYPTPEHLEALERLGPCPEHRRSFAPVRRLLAPGLFDNADQP